jgi:hypothetical protein
MVGGDFFKASTLPSNGDVYLMKVRCVGTCCWSLWAANRFG